MGRTAEKRPKKRPPWLVPARATGWRECRRSRRRSCRPLTRAEKRGARERERGRESVVKITGPLDDEKSRGRIQRRKGGGVMKFAPSLVEALCRATQRSIYIYIYILAGDFFD